MITSNVTTLSYTLLIMDINYIPDEVITTELRKVNATVSEGEYYPSVTPTDRD